MAAVYGFPKTYMGAAVRSSFDFNTPASASRPTTVHQAVPSLALPSRAMQEGPQMRPYEDMLLDPVTGSPRGRSKGLPDRSSVGALSPGGVRSCFSGSDPNTPTSPSTPWYDDGLPYQQQQQLQRFAEVSPAKPVYRTSLGFLAERTEMREPRIPESSEDSMPTSPVAPPHAASPSSFRPKRDNRRRSSHSSSNGGSPYGEFKFEDGKRKRRPSPKQVRQLQQSLQDAMSYDSASDSMEPLNSYYSPRDSMDVSRDLNSAPSPTSILVLNRQVHVDSQKVPPSAQMNYDLPLPLNSHSFFTFSSLAAVAGPPHLPQQQQPQQAQHQYGPATVMPSPHSVEDDIASSCSDLEYTPRYDSLFTALDEYQALSATRPEGPGAGDFLFDDPMLF